MRSCDLLDAELALDRVESELARELPPHLRAFAASHTSGRPEPAAPAILQRTSTIDVARRALPHPLLVERGLALLRLAVPVALHVPRSTSYAAMVAGREAIARRLFGIGAVEVMHRLAGVTVSASATEPVPDAPRGWREPDGVRLDPSTAWRELAARHGVAAGVCFVASTARARTFVVAPDEHVVVVPVDVTTPAARFAVMHELGHVLAACLSPPGLPRVLDEAIAAVTALAADPLAIAARGRRRALARRLDAIERGLAPPPPEVPWPLWHDPGAQAAYVEAEDLADALAAAPDLRAAIAAHRDRIDRLPIRI